MGNEILVTGNGKPDRVCGVYLQGMNLKEYMQKCLDGTIAFPVGVEPINALSLIPPRTMAVEVIPQLPLIAITMACGERVVYRTVEELPEGSVPCSCGDPTHWFVFVEKEES